MARYSRDRWAHARCLVLDLEKAFDTLEWEFLFSVLRKYGLGEEYLGLVKLLYTSPTARVRTGPYVSRQIPIERGTRQGCPLSPLLFALAIEPLAETLRSTQDEWGIPLGYGTHTVSLYADDLLICLRDVGQSCTVIEDALSRFAAVSGLKVNWEKLCLYPFGTSTPDPRLVINGGAVRWQQEAFLYLGILLYSDDPDLLEGNLVRAATSIQAQMAFWGTLPLAVMGRIALLKMVILSRLLYYFTNLPLLLGSSFLKSTESDMQQFIWRGSCSRVSLTKMYPLTSRGGLSLPNMEQYYLAAQLQWVARWLGACHLEDTATQVPGLTHSQVVTLFHPGRKGRVPTKLLVWVVYQCHRCSLRIKNQVFPYAPSLPILGTPRRCGAVASTELTHWEEVDVHTLSDLYNDGQLM